MPALLILLTLVLLSLPARSSEPLRASEPCSPHSPQLMYGECPNDTLVYHHNDTFEQAFSGCCGWTQPPYYGAWGEAFDLGPGTILCAVYWITTIPNQYQGELADCYIWEGGIHTTTGNILTVVQGVTFENIPVWPEIGTNFVEFNLHVEGDFTVGYWGVWPDEPHGFKCAVDLDGPGGYPLCHVAPSITEESGWQDPHDYFFPDQPTQSMGIGLSFSADPNPVQSNTWGAIKALR